MVGDSSTTALNDPDHRRHENDLAFAAHHFRSTGAADGGAFEIFNHLVPIESTAVTATRRRRESFNAHLVEHPCPIDLIRQVATEYVTSAVDSVRTPRLTATRRRRRELQPLLHRSWGWRSRLSGCPASQVGNRNTIFLMPIRWSFTTSLGRLPTRSMS